MKCVYSTSAARVFVHCDYYIIRANKRTFMLSWWSIALLISFRTPRHPARSMDGRYDNGGRFFANITFDLSRRNSCVPMYIYRSAADAVPKMTQSTRRPYCKIYYIPSKDASEWQPTAIERTIRNCTLYFITAFCLALFSPVPGKLQNPVPTAPSTLTYY